MVVFQPVKEKMPPRNFTSISLFSGAMGLDLGLERTGRYVLLACVEKERAFCDTIRLNREKGRLSNPKLRVFEGDISNLDPMKVLDAVGLKPGELDLLCGGPPCQSFSTAGSRGTIQDHRGTMLWQFLRFIEAMRPRFFLMENVRGLLSAGIKHRQIKERPDHGGPALTPDEEPGSVVRQFAKDLGAIAGTPYRMDCFEVNAVNYGAPQLRERALFIGNRFNAVVNFPDPTHGVALDASGGDTLFGPSPALKPWRTLRDAIGNLKEADPVVMDFSPRKKKYLAMVPPGSNWRSLPVDVQKESMGAVWHAKGGRSGWWRRLNFDLPSPTLVTMPNHAGTSLCHPTELRALTLKEYELIQEFPHDWELCGTASQQYAQVGNAVPVRLGEVAGEVIAKAMDSLATNRWPVRSEKAERYRIIYVQSHVRTRQWFKDGKTFIWDDGNDNGRASYGTPKTKRRVKSV
ncbi:MAG TPA: DNA (cytosine-5-)-methyltransferase [Tepidisphaeraceae bacterium]|jgi:DNA (cytosine-5)-methyltransferase 1|nr:DNA (cytosine-5-)-methyltransferase [Tepidisphaeraceae bacterium]